MLGWHSCDLPAALLLVSCSDGLAVQSAAVWLMLCGVGHFSANGEWRMACTTCMSGFVASGLSNRGGDGRSLVVA